MKILLVFGTRPEAIKMCPLVLELAKVADFEVKVCVTAQHREMLDQVLDIYEIEPDYDLNLMRSNQTLEWLTGAIIEGVGNVIKEFSPQLVLVHGDTTTSFAAALAAFYQKVDVGHVEAGLRTGDIKSPWPEEANRKLTATLSTLHFAPTESSKKNLLNEGILASKIHVTGNTVIDSLFQAIDIIKKDSFAESAVISSLKKELSDKKVILITGHRRENFGPSFENICLALKEIAITNPDCHLVYPVHLNPMVQKPVFSHLGSLSNVHLIAPLDYLSFVSLMDRADIILTDSGGIQEEAPSLKKPVLVLREKTERPEAVKAGTVQLIGTNKSTIVKAVTELLDNSELFESQQNPYGDGLACQRIVNIIREEYEL
ncbi:UDP-N-acetyl glucosamine 2-epimerase [Shewanella sairae]|uniref:UDP-N-acetylglucosamine 2-epimerase (non-hydrolyzing) n=1 Tax=Shewanella sairae TaxID=190310 RepID=A0ABQ4PQ08_9GAMM|nr:UDP-N-acetylglucosamine 2-epimerase (non-hydrolyzing) [Shewanella sairae]GIU51044.1 UDP-N-acetyl glucosamine 2-epimerase [Shewanella sairae]